jgi:hypothetical protein
MDESGPDEASPTDEVEQDDEVEPAGETAWQRRRRLAAVFGDVLPETTSDEQDPEGHARQDDAHDRWLRSQVPPHHG